MSPRKIPKSGPDVFPVYDPTKGKEAVVPVGGKLLKVRLPNVPVVRGTVTDAEYCGDEPKGAA